MPALFLRRVWIYLLESAFAFGDNAAWLKPLTTFRSNNHLDSSSKLANRYPAHQQRGARRTNCSRVLNFNGFSHQGSLVTAELAYADFHLH